MTVSIFLNFSPDLSPDFPASRRCVVFAALLLTGASLAWTPAAHAQVGLGAERYEVTITPPKRPGSEAAADAGTPEVDPDNVLGAGSASPSADAAGGNAAHGGPASAAGSSAPAASAPMAPAAAKASGPDGDSAGRSTTTPAAEPVVAPGPPRTLQVGAFRQSNSAVALRGKLAASFAEVTIAEVQSGGEPLYRVYVGRLARGAALEDLKKRLVAAGYPAFEVPAPGPSAPN